MSTFKLFFSVLRVLCCWTRDPALHLITTLAVLCAAPGTFGQRINVDKISTNSTVYLTGTPDWFSAANGMYDWILTNRSGARVVSISPFRPASIGGQRTLITIKSPSGTKESVSFIFATNYFMRTTSTAAWEAFISGLIASNRSVFFLGHRDFIFEVMKRSPVDEVVPYMIGQLTNDVALAISIIDPMGNAARPARASDMAAHFLILNLQEAGGWQPILPEFVESTAVGVKLAKFPVDSTRSVQLWWKSRGNSLFRGKQLTWNGAGMKKTAK